MLDIVKENITQSITLREQILQDELLLNSVVNLSKLAINTLKSGNKIIFAGNGGSFADAQHLAAEFVGRFLTDRTPLAALCLGTNSSSTTSIANDYSFTDIFSRELSAIGQKGDLFIPISTSGNSSNLIKTATIAEQKNIEIFCLLGKNGGKLSAYNNIIVPSSNTARIQEIHITIGHILCELVDMNFR